MKSTGIELSFVEEIPNFTYTNFPSDTIGEGRHQYHVVTCKLTKSLPRKTIEMDHIENVTFCRLVLELFKVYEDLSLDCPFSP